jgi:hypothetical protein
MKIGININDIIRDVWSKIKQVHEKYYDSEIEGTITEKNILKKLDFENDERLLDFLFEEAPMEIFGHSKEVSPNLIQGLNDYLIKNPTNQLILISDEVGRGIPATYWFLAKYGCQIKNIKFIRQKEKKNIWDNFDVIISDDEKIIKNKPKTKTLISTRKFKNVDITIKKPIEILNLEIFKNES